MKLLNTLYNLMGLVFVLGTICSMGLSLTMAQITGPLHNARFLIVALVANFVVVLVAAYLLIQVFSLDGSLATGWMLVSLAAGAMAGRVADCHQTAGHHGGGCLLDVQK